MNLKWQYLMLISLVREELTSVTGDANVAVGADAEDRHVEDDADL